LRAARRASRSDLETTVGLSRSVYRSTERDESPQSRGSHVQYRLYASELYEWIADLPVDRSGVHPVRRWLALVLCAACGDDLRRDDVLAATSGSRLALQLYRYEDGTEQPDPIELYDKQEHTKCAPQTWHDGIVRCTPIADDAVFIDPT